MDTYLINLLAQGHTTADGYQGNQVHATKQ